MIRNGNRTTGETAAPDEALITTEALARRLDDPGLRILDASYYLPGQNRAPADEFAKGHLPGAQFFDIDAISDRNSELPHMLASAEAFARDVGRLGIDNDTCVVIYDSNPMFGSCRAWWMFRAFGHRKVMVLDGGLPKWIREGRPVSASPAYPAECRFTAELDDTLVTRLDEMRRLVGGGGLVVDARPAERFSGQAPEPRPGLRRGHMPAARNLPYASLIDGSSGCLLTRDALMERFADAGIDPAQRITISCGSGITACIVALGLWVVGARDVSVYDGSWAEWGGRSDTPVTAGAAFQAAP